MGKVGINNYKDISYWNDHQNKIAQIVIGSKSMVPMS